MPIKIVECLYEGKVLVDLDDYMNLSEKADSFDLLADTIYKGAELSYDKDKLSFYGSLSDMESLLRLTDSYEYLKKLKQLKIADEEKAKAEAEEKKDDEEAE